MVDSSQLMMALIMMAPIVKWWLKVIGEAGRTVK